MSQLTLNFQANIIRFRAKKKLSLLNFARLLGVTSVAILNWEKGYCRPSLNNIKLVAEKLNITEVQLVSPQDEEPMPKPERELRICKETLPDIARVILHWGKTGESHDVLWHRLSEFTVFIEPKEEPNEG